MLQNIIIEGLDRLGKSTLIEGIQERLGFFTVVHYSKPKTLSHYVNQVGVSAAKQAYQRESFEQMFKLLSGEARLILDRAHLGEAVYAKRYRGYDGDYVFDLEGVKQLTALNNTLLVLLVNDDKELEHKLVDDGDSFDWSKREEEQRDFCAAWTRSRFANKLRIGVGSKGKFVDKTWIIDSVVNAYLDPARHFNSNA